MHQKQAGAFRSTGYLVPGTGCLGACPIPAQWHHNGGKLGRAARFPEGARVAQVQPATLGGGLTQARRGPAPASGVAKPAAWPGPWRASRVPFRGPLPLTVAAARGRAGRSRGRTPATPNTPRREASLRKRHGWSPGRALAAQCWQPGTGRIMMAPCGLPSPTSQVGSRRLQETMDVWIVLGCGGAAAR